MGFQRVLVPIDFSNDSLSAFQVAQERFAGPDNTLVLVHVIDPSGPVMQQPHEIRSGLIEDLRRRLATLGNSRKDGWKEVIHTIESGKPADAIIATARNEAVDMVIMGSHGDNSLKKALFGSTTYDVARKVACSVTICKNPGK